MLHALVANQVVLVLIRCDIIIVPCTIAHYNKFNQNFYIGKNLGEWGSIPSLLLF